MNAERRIPVLFTDRERFERLLDLLPEQKAQGFVDYLEHLMTPGEETVQISGTGILKEKEDYEIDIRNSVLFVFTNPEIQHRFQEFNAAYGALYDFVEDPGDGRIKERPAAEIEALSRDFLRTYRELLTTAVRELGEKGEDDGAVKKGKKRLTLPKFPRTEWSRVSIRFVGDRDVLLSDGKDTRPSDFEGLGCEDNRSQRPDYAWRFLLGLAKGNGQIRIESKKDREHVKKQKQKITDILRMIFKNDSDPFEAEKGGIYVAKFVIGFPKDESNVHPPGKYADLETVRSEMTESRDEE